MNLTAEHNRHGNDAEFKKNKPHFQNQAEKVLHDLLRGETVTGLLMATKYGIQDIRPRIAAIKKVLEPYGVQLQESKVPNIRRAKQWSIAQDDLHKVSELVKKIAV